MSKKSKRFDDGGGVADESELTLNSEAAAAGLRAGKRAANTFKQEGEYVAPAPAPKPAQQRQISDRRPAVADGEALAPKFSTIASTDEIAKDVTAGTPTYGQRAASEMLDRKPIMGNRGKELNKRPQRDTNTRAKNSDSKYSFNGGGKVSSVSRGDGIAQRGKTRGKYI